MQDKEIDVNWTPTALKRLDEIYEYIAFNSKSVDPAIRVTDAIFDRTDQLKSFPELGAKEPLLEKLARIAGICWKEIIKFFMNIIQCIRW